MSKSLSLLIVLMSIIIGSIYYYWQQDFGVNKLFSSASKVEKYVDYRLNKRTISIRYDGSQSLKISDSANSKSVTLNIDQLEKHLKNLPKDVDLLLLNMDSAHSDLLSPTKRNKQQEKILKIVEEYKN